MIEKSSADLSDWSRGGVVFDRGTDREGSRSGRKGIM